MKLLHIGDVVGAAGSRFLQEHLPAIKRTHKIDMIVVNGENSAQGNGITKHSMEQIFSAGADVITTGNHCFKRREAMAIYENPVVLRPANYPEGCPGHGVCTIDFGPCQVAVLNLSGTAYLDPLDNPFTIAEQLLEEIDTPNILVDFHAEATAEKKAMGYFLAGRVTAVVGTHTHVQTADETILSEHTGYITDVGMTGPEESILGVAVQPRWEMRKNVTEPFAVQPAMDRFRFHYPTRFTEGSDPCFLNGVIVTFDEKCGKCTKIERLIVR